MRLISIIVLVFAGLSSTPAQSQSLLPHRDEANHFEIGIPAGWVVRGNGPDNRSGIKLLVLRARTEAADTPRESFNLNVLHKPGSSLQREARKFLNYSKETGNFNLQEIDSVDIGGQEWIWFVDSHQNDLVATPMLLTEYVFIAYKDETTYILTFTTLAERFQKYRPVFSQVAHSLHLL